MYVNILNVVGGEPSLDISTRYPQEISYEHNKIAHFAFGRKIKNRLREKPAEIYGW